MARFELGLGGARALVWGAPSGGLCFFHFAEGFELFLLAGFGIL